MSKLIHGFAAVAAAGIGRDSSVVDCGRPRQQRPVFYKATTGSDEVRGAVCKAIESIRVSDYSYRFLLYAIVWYGTLAVDEWAVTFGTGWQFWNTC